MIAAHGIEKGLSFREFEPRRGVAKLRNALSLIRKHRAMGLPADDPALVMALDAIHHYRQRHAEAGVDIDDLLSDAEHLHRNDVDCVEQSVRLVDPEAFTRAEREIVLAGMRERRSIREFGEGPIDPAVVEAAVTDALSTPSVCNRQGFRAHYSLDRATIDAALRQQNGNSGFGDRVPGLMIVTCSLSIFTASSERNQGFVDGGLFSMSLMLTLHHHGLGNCPLNWSASFRQDQNLRAAVSIPEDEVIIMMIAFGPMPEKPLAAGSRRYDLAHFLTRLERRGTGKQ
ncbi:nitroreductase family protein [Aurantiacibacter odishensis]|uniref:nitroreductase family protein n=1 Tax=Aurantiacibacter odishensis TaxID=1155476 RepID=UPI00196B9939|nr:nitroreductase family protein [Aurantiacibacter odishensis]